MRVLLIGGTGILSTDITRLCLKKGMDVFILNRGNSNELIDEKINILVADIRKKEEVIKKIKNFYFDVVIDFLSFNKSQLESTLEIFNGKCNQFIFISSATVYKKTEKDEKITENTELKNDLWEYSSDKIECEKYLADNYKQKGQKYTIVRPYVTYSEKRIPFAIIPNNQWSLANRIKKGKAIVLWDAGEAVCTLTQSKDFAIGIVGLFCKEKAFQQAFHITTDYTLTWRQALLDIGNALNSKVNIVDIPSDYIVKILPELKGVLYGDKGLNRIFDNSKIKECVPEFSAKTKFKDGIKETIRYYEMDEKRRKVDYFWDGRMDYLIKKYYKYIGKRDYDVKMISNFYNRKDQNMKQKFFYYIGRYEILNKLYIFLKRGKK